MIRWITKDLGTAPFTDSEIGDDLNVLDVRDLVDKHGNSAQATREKIDQGVALLQQGRKLVICCDYGISRSNAIAVGILSVKHKISLEAAIRQVMKATGEHEVKLDPLRAVRSALDPDKESIAVDEPRVLITGGNGLIGRRLRECLEGEMYCIVTTRREADLMFGALELDLLVKEHKINWIIHLANPRIYTSIHAMGETITLLRNVLEVCKENGARLIYPSDCEVYSGYQCSSLIADENLPIFAKGPYGEAKMLCESLIELHRKHYGLKCGILRSCRLYSSMSDRPKFIYNFIFKALKGEAIKTHHYLNGEAKIELLHVDDFVSAIKSAIKSNFDCTINIGSGCAVSTKVLAEWIVKETGSSSVVESREIEDFVANISMSRKAVQQQLSWQPTITWQAGVLEIIDKQILKTSKNEDSNEHQ